jgi:hypothetical protein
MSLMERALDPTRRDEDEGYAAIGSIGSAFWCEKDRETFWLESADPAGLYERPRVDRLYPSSSFTIRSQRVMSVCDALQLTSVFVARQALSSSLQKRACFQRYPALWFTPAHRLSAAVADRIVIHIESLCALVPAALRSLPVRPNHLVARRS